MGKIKNPVTIVNSGSSSQNEYKYATEVHFFKNYGYGFPVLPTNFEIWLPKATELNRCFGTNSWQSSPSGCETIIIHAGYDGEDINNMLLCFGQTSPQYLGGTLRYIKFDFTTKYVSSFRNLFQNSWSALTTIDAIFDFTSANYSNADNYDWNIPNVASLQFVPNTLGMSMYFGFCSSFNDETVISLANCLRNDVTGKTLGLHSTPKSRCSLIIGTVIDGIFVADSSGTVTLSEFITNTKGWTLS